jgi:hypothetical protein
MTWREVDAFVQLNPMVMLTNAWREARAAAWSVSAWAKDLRVRLESDNGVPMKDKEPLERLWQKLLPKFNAILERASALDQSWDQVKGEYGKRQEDADRKDRLIECASNLDGTVRLYIESANLLIRDILGWIKEVTSKFIVPVVELIGTPQELANQILVNQRISLATTHVSGHADTASSQQNIRDTAAGEQASRSSYGTAPGGHINLDRRLLRGLLRLTTTFSFRVSELAGGEHTARSPHYDGRAADIDMINGRKVAANNPNVHDFRQAAQALGAFTLGPGDANHDRHVHISWPPIGNPSTP